MPQMKVLQSHPRLRFELIFGGCALLAGLFVMPIFIYLTGVLMLGPYEAGGFGAFLKQIFVGLGQGSVPIWLMVLGPYVILNLFRATLLVHRKFAND